MTNICWIKHIKIYIVNYIGNNVLCVKFLLKELSTEKKCRWKGSETNTWSKIGLHSCPILALHHMSSNSFAILRLNKFEIAL
jgi:hypothetical protein